MNAFLALIDLHTLIAAGEPQTLEFKSSVDKAAIESLVTFTQTSQLEPISANGVDLGAEKSSEKILHHLKGEPSLSAQALAERLEISSRAIEKQIALGAASTRIYQNFMQQNTR